MEKKKPETEGVPSDPRPKQQSLRLKVSGFTNEKTKKKSSA